MFFGVVKKKNRMKNFKKPKKKSKILRNKKLKIKNKK